MSRKLLAPPGALYKLLGPNGTPCNGGRGTWPLPNGKPGAWLKVAGEIVPCENGLHLCQARNLIHDWMGPLLYMAEPRPGTTCVRQDDKIVVREARLLRQIETWNDQTLRLFAADCAERALQQSDVTDPRCHEAVQAARQYAFGLIDDAARDAAWAAAWDAAWAAARAAAGEAARAAARAAAGDAARAAARDAARAAAGDAAGGAAWDAAWDAAGAAAGAAARDAEQRWQTKRLFAYLNGRVDLNAIRRSVV